MRHLCPICMKTHEIKIEKTIEKMTLKDTVVEFEDISTYCPNEECWYWNEEQMNINCKTRKKLLKKNRENE